jgi:hypothetical protein
MWCVRWRRRLGAIDSSGLFATETVRQCATNEQEAVMDGESFDAVAQRVSGLASRRGVLRAGAGALTGVALGILGLSTGEVVGARRRRRKRCGAGGTCYVFVTENQYGGSIGGLAGADEICQILATASSLRGTYKAWLSDSTASPSTRFVHSTGPYKLLDGTQIAANWTQLTDGSLGAPINITEIRSAVAGSEFVWTHTLVDGTAAPSDEHCGNWKDATATVGGGRGVATLAESNWTQSGTDSCDSGHHLYCFQQSGR